ncbi:hypothetical protein BDFB_014458 [Asbolus verrucosus]|uniref:Uncharacterized protein n=1 Tax=Asbolus verrucosus TaxID=1661398 RepID=A0A482W438_ASBVE|nr:hypothetical protein BDFB_014458 [Asbolus verrucosus]
MISEKTYVVCQNQIMDNARNLAVQGVIAAGKEEYRLAVEAKDVNAFTPLIAVIVDGTWSKRSYKSN